MGKLVDLLLLGGVSLKAPGLTIGVNLAVLLEYSSILSCCIKVLGDDGINSAPQALVMRVGPVNTSIGYYGYYQDAAWQATCKPTSSLQTFHAAERAACSMTCMCMQEEITSSASCHGMM